MNSERRHELQQNDLADLLGLQIKKVEKHGKLIIAVIAIVAAAAIAWALYRSAALSARSDATLQLLQNAGSGDPEPLGAIGERYGETTAGALAKVFQADALLASGITALFNDREEAEPQLTEALRRYTEAAELSNELLVSSRANFGLARAHESLGQLDQAIAAYNRVVTIGESEAITAVAQQRIERLKSPQTQEFLAWFERQDFRPADPSQPPTMPTGGSLPDFPDVQLPDVSPRGLPDELRGPASDAPAPGEITLPAETTDAATTPPPTPQPPAETPPTSTPPAGDDQTDPADAPETPAEPADSEPADPEPADEAAVEPVIEVDPGQ
jgi:predicted negative regulator of RcsB-dependent stress response